MQCPWSCAVALPSGDARLLAVPSPLPLAWLRVVARARLPAAPLRLPPLSLAGSAGWCCRCRAVGRGAAVASSGSPLSRATPPCVVWSPASASLRVAPALGHTGPTATLKSGSAGAAWGAQLSGAGPLAVSVRRRTLGLPWRPGARRSTWRRTPSVSRSSRMISWDSRSGLVPPPSRLAPSPWSWKRSWGLTPPRPPPMTARVELSLASALASRRRRLPPPRAR